jgi:ribonuclease III
MASRSAGPAHVEKTLGYRFKDRALLEEARTHASARAIGATLDNTRLAFLGDAVVDLAETQRIFERFRSAERGELTDRRKERVSDAALAIVARRKKLGRFLHLGPAEEKEGREKTSLLASFVEALIGAVFVEAGYEAASRVAQRLMGKGGSKRA